KEMKRTLVLFALIMLVSAAFAQMKKDRTSAYNYWMKKDLVKAKEFIDKAIAYPEAVTDSKVWFYRGNIYLDIQLSPAKAVLAPDAINVAYDAYLKAKELDTKEEFKEDITARMAAIGGEFFNEGISYFQQNNFDGAIPLFDKAIKISADNHVIDTLANYGAALCLEKKASQDVVFLDQAIAKYQYLVDIKMKEVSVYTSLANLYKDKGNLDKASEIIGIGKTLFPGNTDLIITEANMYISTNNHAKAVSSLMVAKEKEPKNVSVLYAIGVTYDLLKNDTKLPDAERADYFTKATDAYKEAIAVDSNYFDAIFNLGAIYFNKGGEVINEANKLPISETAKYDKLLAEGNNYLNLSLPYLEKCEKIQPLDKPTLVSLKEIYTRLNKTEKLGAINAKLSTL
ncbi:MAG: tetratricopeptide repeat protein, partial [Bacteroidota bacterium]